MRLKPHEAQSYRKKVLWVSWVSIVITTLMAIAAFTVSVMRHSASAFGFAFNAVLDVLSSAIVLWRYRNAAAVHSAHREYIACVILGVVFILSSLCIMGKAIHDLATKLLPEVDDFLFSVSIVSGVVCCILAVIKFMLGKVLTSRVLITDGFNSLVGGVMGFSILISVEVFKHEPQVWYLDGSIGVLMGLTILAYGIKLLLDMVPRVRQTRSYERFE
ncbi:transmembrane protein 163-like isoform X7 [Pseudoliparis swirei]|nr:transmembrane protein 163-like isoform X7 [Pseudoliparis swirei]